MPDYVRRFIAPRKLYARAAVLELVELSAWFECTPLPDEEWQLTVKDEERPVKSMRALMLKEG